MSSDDVVHHRLSRAGDRQLNSCPHIMAHHPIRHDTSGRAYYPGKRTDGKSHKEALRCLSGAYPTPSTAAWCAMHTPTPRRAREDTRGDYEIQRGQLNFYRRLFGTSRFPDR